MNMSLPAEGGTLTFKCGRGPASRVNLKMTRSTEQGVQVFRHQAIPLAGGDIAQFRFGHWPNTNQGIPLATTHNGQSTTRTLANQGTEQQP